MDDFVRGHLKGVSRTYAILIPMLPAGLADAVGLGYLLMRIVDTLEDDTTIDDARRVELLRSLDAALAAPELRTPPEIAQPLGELPAERRLMLEAAEVLRRVAALPAVYRDAALTCARRMIGGVLLMLARSAAREQPYPAVTNATELRTYCYYVAGVVGEMLCTVMAHHLRQPALLRLNALAVELGIGLQLVNIVKDSMKDSAQGRRYLPTHDGRVDHAEVYRAALAQARDSLERGAQFVLALPAAARELRSFCGLPIAWGALTLNRAETGEGKAKIDRRAVEWTIDRFMALAGDDRALPHWLRSLLRPNAPAAPLPG